MLRQRSRRFLIPNSSFLLYPLLGNPVHLLKHLFAKPCAKVANSLGAKVNIIASICQARRIYHPSLGYGVLDTVVSVQYAAIAGVAGTGSAVAAKLLAAQDWNGVWFKLNVFQNIIVDFFEY